MRSALKATLFALICVSCFATSVVAKGNTQQSNSLDKIIAATPEYDLDITLLPDSHRMEVTGTLRLPPRDSPRQTIELGLSELMKDFRVEIIEPAESAGPMTVTKGEKKNPQDNLIRWLLKPNQPIAANKFVRMRFSCQGGESVAVVFYIGPEGSFAGGSNTAWYPQMDENEGRGRGRLKFSVPAGHTVVATGNSRGVPSKEAEGNFEFEIKVPTKVLICSSEIYRFEAGWNRAHARLLASSSRQCRRILGWLIQSARGPFRGIRQVSL